MTRSFAARWSALCGLIVMPVAALSAQPPAPSSTARVAHSPSARAHGIPVPSATAVAKRGALVLDGILDDDAWQHAPPITELRQFDPDHALPSSQRIDVRFVFDDAALYVGARLYDQQGPSGVISTVVRRDAFFNSDFFEVAIDGFHDHLGRAIFQVNPSGSRSDLLGVGGNCCDGGWDPVWDARTTIDADGWSVEMRIPFSQLRFSRDSAQSWGLQVRRFIKRREETAQWAMWTRTEQGGPARFGHLEGITIDRSPAKLELMPFVASQASRLDADPADPFRGGTQATARAGLDVRYLLTPNLTLDATINPDFGQVEVDPAVVNLSAFENFFSERRPFFVSGSGVFSFGDISCNFCSNVSSLQAFYSRRVGRAPTGADLATSQGEYADVPNASPILGAAKITGRTASGYTIGVLNAVTGRTLASVQRADGTRLQQEVEPLANYFVGRLKKDFRRGDLVVGAIGSSLTRNLSDAFESRLTRHAELIGTDWQYQWANRAYSFRGALAASNVSGDARVIAARQRASARFFQRPDRPEGNGGFFATQYDTTATALRGYGGYARLAKQAGDWRWESGMNVRNPGFETNDYSFLTNADYIWNNLNVIRLFAKPTRWYRNVALVAGGQAQRNFAGDVTNNTDLHALAEVTTPQFWYANAFVLHRPAGMINDRLLRGGPSVRTEGSTYLQGSLATDSRKQWRAGIDPLVYRTTLGGHGHGISMFARVQPSTRTFLSFGPSYNRSLDKLQYVRAVADPTAAAFGGSRYILSDVDQHQLAFDTRFNVTFTPWMTLELWAQPFFASGHYANFKEFDAPRQAGVSVYGRDRGTLTANTDSTGHTTGYTVDPDASGPAVPFSLTNPDFTLRSLRGSAVFRWEYRPGSTLFLVWTQQRSDQGPEGDFNFSRERHALAGTRPNNVFMIKATWWLAR